MVRVFITHSRKDEALLEDIKKIFKETKVFYDVYDPKSTDKKPDWEYIRTQISKSDAIFLLLGPSINPEHRESAHTQNWVSFEVGLACSCNPPKRVIVFHPAYNPKKDSGYDQNKFAIPYFTDYVYYDSNNPNSYSITLDIISHIRTGISLKEIASKSFGTRMIDNGVIKRSSPEDGTEFIFGDKKCPKCKIQFGFFSCDCFILCPNCNKEINLLM